MSTGRLREAATEFLQSEFHTPQTLRELGVSRRRAALLIDQGAIVRLRNGRYVHSETHPSLIEAGRCGGRLTCVSLLAAIGVFVRVPRGLHLQFTSGTTRLPPRPAHVTAHWWTATVGRCRLTTDLLDALVQSTRCQRPRDAIATLESAWHHDLVDEADIAEIFRRLPLKYQSMRQLLDRRSESGAETLMRLLLRALGCDVKVQRQIPGVGRVDLIVDGWLIVECDSRAFHEGWTAQARDRRRDLAAAALGYTTVRPLAEDIYYDHDSLVRTMKSVVQNSTTAMGRL